MRLFIASATVALGVVGCLGETSDGRPVGDRCADDSECAADLVCLYGHCRSLCAFDRDCPAGEVCIAGQDSAERVCTVPDEHVSSECPPGMAWLEGEAVCREPCSEDPSSCPSGYHCLENMDGRRICVDEAIECLAYMALCMGTSLTSCVEGHLVTETCPGGCAIDGDGGRCL